MSRTFKTSDAYVFVRASLQLTCDLLRKPAPQLSLTIRNLLSQPPIASLSAGVEGGSAEYFLVDIDSMLVRDVVETLAQCIQGMTPENPQQTGKIIMAKALIDDWLLLAQHMIQQLTNNDLP